MNRSIRTILTVLVALLSLSGNAVSPDRLVSGYAVMPVYNPAAVTGVADKARVNIIGSFGDEAESVSSKAALFQGSAPFSFGCFKLGVGLDAAYFKAAEYTTMQSHIELSAAVRLAGGVLSAGIAPGFSTYKAPADEIKTEENPKNQAKYHHNSFSLNAGVQYQTSRFYIGAGITDAGEKSATVKTADDESRLTFDRRCMARFMGGATIPAGIVEILPTVMVSTDFSYSRTDMLARLRFLRRFTLGGGWSTSRMAAVVAGIDMKDFHVGYVYALSTAGGSFKRRHHEIFAGYSFKINLTKTNRYGSKSIRFM